MKFFRKIFDYFLYTNLFMVLCAIVMTAFTINLFLPARHDFNLYGFIASATLLSYNLHWYLLNDHLRQSPRISWTKHHKRLLIILCITGGLGVIFFILRLSGHWITFAIPALITSVYTAPKLPAFKKLQALAFGKTFLLAFTWTYVTVIMPAWMYKTNGSHSLVLFGINRFLFIYAICLLFDYRDREEDLAQGLATLPSRVSGKMMKFIFFTVLFIFFLSTIFLVDAGISMKQSVIILIPGIILALLYPKAIHNFSDYLFYFVLDGLMMLSGLLSIIMAF